MSHQAEAVKILSSEFQKLRTRNPSYSLRAFARKIGISPSHLSGILNGQVQMTNRIWQRFQNQVQIDPRKSVQIASQLKNRSAKNAFTQIDMDQYHLIAEWYYFAILSLSETKNFRSDVKWIAERLNITLPQTRSALKRLERQGFLRRDSNGDLAPSGLQLATSSGVSNVTLRYSHFQSLELVRASLEACPTELCDFGSVTMAIDPKKIPEARRRIQKFRRSLCKFLESGEKTEVYRIFTQLFPLTKMSKEQDL
jgi:uncharacterized protein (TIGR02147 family)